MARFLPNAAPAAALAAPAQVADGRGGSRSTPAAPAIPRGRRCGTRSTSTANGSYELDGGANPLAVRSFAAPGTYTVGVRVTDPRGGDRDGDAQHRGRNRPRAPQPLLGKQGVARPLRGIVRYRLPGKRRFVRLVGLTAIPNGTEIDARKGRVLLTVLHDASGQLDSARFYAGRFMFNQGKGRSRSRR